MKDQHMKLRKRSVLRLLPVALLMILLVVFTAVSANADAQAKIVIGWDDLEFSGVTLTNDIYTKVYDGTTDVTVAIKSGATLQGLDPADGVTVTVESAAFNSANVTEATEIVIRFKLEGDTYNRYMQPATVTVPARITPKELTWDGNAVLNTEITYDPNVSSYELGKELFAGVALPKFSTAGLSDQLAAEVNALKPAITGVSALGALNANDTAYETTAAVETANANFTAPALKVTVKVNPIVIETVEWTGNKSWTYGDAMPVKVIGYDAKHNAYELKMVCDKPAEFNDGAAQAGIYVLTAVLRDDKNYRFGADAVTSFPVEVLRKELKVSMTDTSVIGDEKTPFQLMVGGKLPAEVLNLIVYEVDGKAFTGAVGYGSYTITAKLPTKNYRFSAEGSTEEISELTAVLTVLRQQKLFPVLNEKGEVVGQIILANRDGFKDSVNATVTAIDGYRKIVKNNRYNQVYKISVTGAEEGQTFSLIIPLSDEVVAPGCHALTVNDLQIYEGASGTLISAAGANKNYTVTLSEGFYQLDGFTGVGETTFVISPDYDIPFYLTAPGILLIILLIILILFIIPFYVGLHLRKILDNKQNPAIIIDTDGVLPPHAPRPEIEGRPEIDEDKAIDDQLNAIAENMDVEPETTETTADEDELNKAVEESMDDLMADTDEVILEEETEEEPAEEPVEEIVEEVEEVEEDTTLPEELADAVALELEEIVEAEETVEETDETEVEEAVAEAMEEAAEETVEEEVIEEEIVEETVEEEVIEEEIVEETVEEEVAEEAVEEEIVEEEIVEEVVEEEVVEEAPVEVVSEETESEDDENDGDDGDGEEDEEAVDAFAFGNLTADPSTFIDVKEKPVEYQEMLERESRGEIHIVHRFKKSFIAKLAQSQGNVQDYYSEIKNALLMYKGVKNRISWNYEAFNKGRTHVAKMIAKSRTLYLYLAIQPEQLLDTKYNFTDVSDKKKYETTPVLMKIKGERKFKHALELIEMLCTQMELPVTENAHVDYKVERMTVDEMVEAGYIKHYAGYILLTPPDPETETADESTVTEAEATENTEVEETAGAVAKETAETPVAEATEGTAEAAEEAPAEDVTTEDAIPADAETPAEGEDQNI